MQYLYPRYVNTKSTDKLYRIKSILWWDAYTHKHIHTHTNILAKTRLIKSVCVREGLMQARTSLCMPSKYVAEIHIKKEHFEWQRKSVLKMIFSMDSATKSHIYKETVLGISQTNFREDVIR